MPTVEPTKQQREQQRQAPPQKDARAVQSTSQKRDPNADTTTDTATLERIQKSHLGSSKDETRKAKAPTMPTEPPKKEEGKTAVARHAAKKWTPVKPPSSGPATRGYGFVDPSIKNLTNQTNSTDTERRED